MIVYLLGTGGNQDHNDHHEVHLTLEGAQAVVPGGWRGGDETWAGPDGVAWIEKVTVLP